jgi:lipoprotein NlpD
VKRHVALILAASALVAGCTARAPAPVVDRLPPAAAKPAAPAVQAGPAAPAGPQTYTVKAGDTLYSIALEHGTDWRELAALNGITDPSRLRIGQALVIRPAAPATAGGGPVVVSPVAPSAPVAARPLGADPAAAPPTPAAPAAAAPGLLRTEPKGLRLPYSEENVAMVQRSDAARPTAAPKPEPAAPVAAAKPEAPAAKPEPPAAAPKPPPDPVTGQIDWGWPAAGAVIGNFNGSSNKGIDIAGRVGDPVLASAPGVVQYVGEGIPSLGKLVIIKHSDTYLSAYAHNSEILVKEAQKVARGQQIARMGATGTTQPKLHFEIRRQGAPLDPLQYLPAR